MQSTYAHARTVDTCVRYEPTEIQQLKKELDTNKIPYWSEPKLICVSEKYGQYLLDIGYKLFPPKPDIISTKIPVTPNGQDMNSFRFNDKNKNISLAKQLKVNNIYTVTDSDGYIWYDISKEKIVRNIIFNLVNEN